MTNSFDVIGDVHGEFARLTELLAHLGYREHVGVWRHPYRTAIFVGVSGVNYFDRVAPTSQL